MTDDSMVIAGIGVRGDFDDDEPRVLDLDLARALGYADPVDIRQLVRRLHKQGRLKLTVTITTKSTSFGKRTTEEFWLDERSAIKIVVRSGAKCADEVEDLVIDTFVRYRRGELVPAYVPPIFNAGPEEITPGTLWPPKMFKLLCELLHLPHLYELPPPGEKAPKPPGGCISGQQERLYEHLLTVEGAAEAKARADKLGCKWHQVMTPRTRKALEQRFHEITVLGEYILRNYHRSDWYDAFWAAIEDMYPLKMSLSDGEAPQLSSLRVGGMPQLSLPDVRLAPQSPQTKRRIAARARRAAKKKKP